ncbi:uncharacterized protein BXZ73DRAFT_47598 [Epithele typhae]|uniref:uncharacterized protein n=1 Tax=Epithele typhae TaxID=378194 RepID=UPI002007639A|nr:uncharacterized protein BXZ73DRAFT_47598 [Epithele typhae]KAH9930457.1 hypothetical protein BXZ73DRAFT_47598 [Epithele typhae]
MSILITPIVVTPLMKVPLLLATATYSYYGMTPPTQPPAKEEMERMSKTENTPITAPILAGVKVSCSPYSVLRQSHGLHIQYGLCSLAVAEAAAILVHAFPSYAASILLHALGRGGRGSSPLPPPSVRGAASAASLAASLLAAAGGLTRVWCHRTLGASFTWQLAVRDGHQLVTGGPYALARHPSYTGWALIALGNVLYLFGPGSYFARTAVGRSAAGRWGARALAVHMTAVSVALCGRAGKEDRMMREEFGEEWGRWARRTPYRLVPWVY